MAGEFAVAQLPARSPLPAWFVPDAPLSCATWTSNELSIVCPATRIPEAVRCERGWRALQLQGPFAFDATGILLGVLQPLAHEGIGIFAISTYDTDYVLVKSTQLSSALAALRAEGHLVESGSAHPR